MAGQVGTRLFHWARIASLLSLLTLAIGVLIGLAAKSSPGSFASDFVNAVAPIGKAWAIAMQVCAIPLTVALLLSAIVCRDRASDLGRIGARTILVFILFLIFGALLSLSITAWVTSSYPPESAIASAGAESLPEGVVSSGGATSIAGFFAAAFRGDMLSIVVLTLLVGLAIRLGPRQVSVWTGPVFEQAARFVMAVTLVGIILMPMGVLGIASKFAVEHGAGFVGNALYFVALVSAVHVIYIALLYPLTASLGRVSMLSFARAAAPAQAAAASTRSSLACLPITMQCARETLRLPAGVVSFVLPLAVSVFKANRTLSSPTKLVFLAAVYGVHLEPVAVVTFIVAVMLLSIASPGLPSMGRMTTFGAYVAAGLPPEGVLMMEPLDPVPDVFKTAANVTANLSSTAIVARMSGEVVEADSGEPVRLPA